MKSRHALLMTVVMLASPLAIMAASNPAAAQNQAGDGSSTTSCEANSGQTIRPLGTPGTWTCTVTIQFSGAGGAAAADPVNFYTASLSETSPSWANVIISPGSQSGQYSGDGNTVDLEFTVTVALTQDAPALTPDKVTIDTTVTTTSEQGVAPSSTDLTVVPDYYNLYNVALQKKIGQGGPQESVDYPITIDNFSNGDTRFTFSLASEDSVPSGFNPTTPDPKVIRSQATGAESSTTQVTFSVYTPYQNGYVNEIGAIQLQIDSAYANDPSKEGVSSTVSTLTQARGFYVPGPGAGLTALSILGVALFLAKRDRLDV